jgi:alpha-galactosidase
MSFGLWVEPEMINPDSDLYQEHPDWVYHFPNRPRTESRNQLVLNLAKEEVRDHLFHVLDRLLTENEISFIKWDMNRPFSEPGWPEAPKETQREVWVRHARGVYEILGRLRQGHPDVAFESCSSGGGRVDLGILRSTRGASKRTRSIW